MRRNRWWLLIGVPVVAIVAIVAGVTLKLSGGGGSKQLTHADFVRLWQGTRIGDPRGAVLARWPKNPYQHYTDSLKNDCYEWADVPDPTRNNMPENLYNLCFKHGVVSSKDLL